MLDHLKGDGMKYATGASFPIKDKSEVLTEDIFLKLKSRSFESITLVLIALVFFSHN